MKTYNLSCLLFFARVPASADFIHGRLGRVIALIGTYLCLLVAPLVQAEESAPLLEIERKVTHGYATNDGVRIHYAQLGEGPLVVMIHGFPDYWLTWRKQMEALWRRIMRSWPSTSADTI